MQKTHHRILRVIYQSDESYKNLLNLDNSVSLHLRHLNILVTKISKSVPKKNPKFMLSYFSGKNLSYNLSPKSTLSGTNSVHFIGIFIWNKLPYFVKSSASIFEFKRNFNALVITVHALFSKIYFVQSVTLLLFVFITYGSYFRSIIEKVIDKINKLMNK